MKKLRMELSAVNEEIKRIKKDVEKTIDAVDKIEKKNEYNFIRNIFRYLDIEIYHAFDSSDIKEQIKKHKEDCENNDPFFIKWFDFYDDFNSFLLKVRYINPNFEENTDKNLTSIYKEYKKYNEECNRMVINSFCEFFKNCNASDEILKAISNQHSDFVETLFIHTYYNYFLDTLKKYTFQDFENNSLNANDSINNDDPQKLFFKKIAIQQAISTELTIKTFERYQKKKIKRYDSDDRISFWKKDFCTDPIKDEIKNQLVHKIEEFMVNSGKNNEFFIKILIAILTKYHIILHQYAKTDFHFIAQYLDQKRVGEKNKIKRAKNAFIFIRLACRYFIGTPIESPSFSIYSGLSLCIQVLTYIRRGYAYLLLKEPQKAFNDFTLCEIKLSQLRSKLSFIDDDNRTFYNYHDLIVPYIYSFKGDIYRSNYSFYNAHQYFCNSQTKLEELSITNANKYLNKSLKMVKIKLAKGKTFLELGEFRKALKWFFQSLKAYFNLLNKSDKANVDNIDDLIEYLEETRLHLEILKIEIYNKIKKIIDNIENVIEKNIKNLEYPHLFCDICTRISMVLILLNLPDYEKNKSRYNKDDDLPRHNLADKLIKIIFAVHKENGFKKALGLAYLNDLILKAINSDSVKKKRDNSYELMHSGDLRDMIYRSIAINILENIRDNRSRTDKEKKKTIIAERLLQRLLLFTEDFSSKNAELYKYLMKKKELPEKNNVYIYGLQRLSSINPALVRPSAFKIKGGGLFITFRNRGIAIDPGINFVENLYAEGFSIGDVDCIIATHDHIDHIADIDTLISGYYRRAKIEGKSPERRPLKLVLNPTVSLRYSFLTNQSPEYFQKIEISEEKNYREIFKGIELRAIKTHHHDLGSPRYSNTLGIVLRFDNKAKIGITSDTYFRENIIDQFIDSDLDVFIVNISGSPLRELLSACFKKEKIDFNKGNYLERIHKWDINLSKEISYSIGYGNFDPKKLKFPSDESWDDLHPKDAISPLGEHLSLHGTLKTYEMFKNASKGRDDKEYGNKLFLISETSEEMGNYRHKVAKYINEEIRGNGPRCFTSDIGLCVRINLKDKKEINCDPSIQIRCSHCSLRNDYKENDIFHPLSEIKEVCLKWEEEGIFYFCPRHDPEGARRKQMDYGFIERLERYQPFRHIDIRMT